jgi:hypothetical protein
MAGHRLSRGWPAAEVRGGRAASTAEAEVEEAEVAHGAEGERRMRNKILLQSTGELGLSKPLSYPLHCA